MRFNLRDQVSERIIAGGHRLEAALSAGRNEQPGNTDGHRVALDVAGVDSDDVLARFPLKPQIPTISVCHSTAQIPLAAISEIGPRALGGAYQVKSVTLIELSSGMKMRLSSAWLLNGLAVGSV